jgi:hypothetical protein
MKESSYRKLKNQNRELFRLYARAMRRLRELGQGIYGDDLLVGGEENIGGIKNARKP